MAFGLAAVMNFGMYWFSDRAVLKMYRARVLGPNDAPDLYQMLDRLRQRAGLPMPTVALAPSEQPNAFATGCNPANSVVCVTAGILKLLPPRELEGVIAHELAHIKHRHMLVGTIAATMAAAIMMVARMAQFAALFGGGSRSNDGEGNNPLAMLVGLFVAPIAAMLIQAAISRSREFVADRGGAEIAGSPLGLANALRKIEGYSKQVPMDANPATAHMFIIKPFSARGRFSLFSTHPPTEQRIAALMGRPA